MIKIFSLVFSVWIVISIFISGCGEKNKTAPESAKTKQDPTVLQDVDLIIRKESLFVSPRFKDIFHNGGYAERVRILNQEQPLPILIEQMLMATGDPFAAYFTQQEWADYNVRSKKTEPLMVYTGPGVELPGNRGLSSGKLPYLFPLRDKTVRPHPEIFYIKIEKFTLQSTLDLAYVLWNFRETNGFKGLVIDLRGNPGGTLSVAINSTDYFLPGEALIATTRYADGSSASWQQDRFTFLAKEKPLVILLDKDSASAAELFSAALRDNKRAIIISRDERTFGKWSIGRSFPIREGRYGALHLSIGFWQTPLGKMAKDGLKPDIQTRWSEQDILENQKNPKWYDPTIFKAIEWLEQRLLK